MELNSPTLDPPTLNSPALNSPTLGFLLHEVARLLKRRFEQNARGSGLTRSQWQVLAYLAQNEGIHQSGLAELLEIEPITLGRIVDKLEAQGLVARHPHPSDRRVWRLHLTAAARPKLVQLRKLGEITRTEALAGRVGGRHGAFAQHIAATEGQSGGSMRFAGRGRKTCERKKSKQWLT